MKRTICMLLMAALYALAYADDGLTLSTVVIDPGHGGKDPGAISKDKKTYEKTLVLDISKRLADKIRKSYPDVKVILTRDSDEFVSLDGRATIANKAGANLFISIHVNSAASSSPNGYSLHLLGQSSNKNKDLFAYNMDVCKAENSVILLEDDKAKYEGLDPDDPESQILAMLMQSAYLEQSLKFAQIVHSSFDKSPIKADRGVWQNPFYVLWKTSMPAVLVEVGFISNSTDLAVLRSADDRDKIASRLFEAFRNYKSIYDDIGFTPSSHPSEPEAAPAAPDVPATTISPVETAAPAGTAMTGPDVKYGVQIFAVNRILYPGSKEFLGYNPSVFKAGTLYKYVIGVDDDLDKVKSNLLEIKKKYSDAFIVKISGDNIEILK